MDEGESGSKANADLLMTSKGILPRRKANEYQAVFLEERLDASKEFFFARRKDMLYDIMNKNDVEAFALRLSLLGKDKVLANKGSLLVMFCKECPCLADAALADVDACHATP